ncbi:Crossover junction endodeoxyribonuclease RuvC [bacterium HR19]|nr:Crossover junction endodeoxyribonuclease RuvC [bacterium HR19]
MVVIGIDPGLRELGWAVLSIKEPKKIKVVSFGVIKTESENGNTTERMWEIGKELERIFRKFSPSLCGIESAFVWKDPSAALKLGLVSGMCIEIARRKKTKTVVLSPLYIKSRISGNHIADKEEMRKNIARKIKKIPKDVPHHVIDAISIGISAFEKDRDEKIQRKMKRPKR